MNRWLLGLLVCSISLMSGAPWAEAVALGKIGVASHLGETFFAEIPMQLEANEKMSSVFVSLAPPADYRILEVYHDSALNTVRSEVKNDSRGIRVELSSDSVMDTPFFNLILKVRHGHATYFKKYAVFLDLPQARVVRVKSLPIVSGIHPPLHATQKTQTNMAVTPTIDTATPAFKPYAGWARTGKYGPIVYGDSIGTVANRLRVDKRYPLQQVIMALFNKNKKQFSQGNVNLIHAGAYLKVPTAREVEAITPTQARALLAQHNKRWNELKKQPHYAAVAKAQKNRYKTRVRMGKDASGVASAPGVDNKANTNSAKNEGKATESTKPATPTQTETTPAPTLQNQQATATANLQKKLKTADARIAALSDELASPDVVAADVRIKKLELSLARLHAQMDQDKQAAKARGASKIQWLTYVLGALVAMLFGAVGFLLTRERPHPAVVSLAASIAPVDSSPTLSREGGIQKAAETAQQEAAEDLDQLAVQMDTQGFKEPEADVTEENASEMEASNIDHMTEAHVYLRYGMTDEAIEQIELALKQQPDNAAAHIKLLETLQPKGDKTRLNAAIEAGRAALSGEGLQTFEAMIAPESAENTSQDDIDLGDTLPVTGIVEIDTEKTTGTDTVGLPEEAEESDVAEGTLEISNFDIGDLEWNAQPVDDEKEKQGLETPTDVADNAYEDSNNASNMVNDGISLDLSMETADLEALTEDLAAESADSTEDEPPVAIGQASEIEDAVSGLDAIQKETNEPALTSDMPADLDELLTELEIDTGETLDTEISQDSLNIDKARSLLAEGALDEAEATFNTAMEVDNKQCDSLIGLAEVAQQRGDGSKATELLAEAEALVDDNNHEWFESIKRKQD